MFSRSLEDGACPSDDQIYSRSLSWSKLLEKFVETSKTENIANDFSIDELELHDFYDEEEEEDDVLYEDLEAKEVA